MRAPHFWWATEGREAAPMLRLALAPLAALVGAAAARKAVAAEPVRVEIPAVCVGNVTVGGAGKTPLVRAIRAKLAARGVAAATLSRGYGGRLRGPVQVDPARHAADDVGDEPLLHAADGPAFVSRDRLAGARAAAAAGLEALVLDDGFQNFALAYALALVVFDAAAGVGNGRVIPAGPLREPLRPALARAHAALVMHPHEAAARAAGKPPYLRGFTRPVFHSWIEPVAPAPAGPLVAFAGLGRPEKLFDTLKAAGAEIADFAPFPDHHRFSAGDLAALRRLAQRHDARLITTEKDHVRLPAAERAAVLAFPVMAKLAEDEAFDRWLFEGL